MASTVDQFLADASAMERLGAALALDDDFREFCIALGVAQPKLIALLKKEDRECHAMREWIKKKERSMDDFVNVLATCRLEALAVDLGLGAQYRATVGERAKK